VLISEQVVGPFPPGAFRAADVRALATYELRKRAGPVMAALIDIVGTGPDSVLEYVDARVAPRGTRG
jgi:hypothetical protein